jgi:hypothetical protein
MYTGRCFCGEVRIELTADPAFACHCHCKSCQQSAGAGFVTWVTFPVNAFVIASGTLVEYRSSPGVTRGHCASCGTSITYIHEDRAGDVDITAACLDDTAMVEPKAHIWLEDRAPWIEINDELPKFQQRVTSI